MPADKDHYSLLGVSRNATPEQLHRAYREAALRLHPDRTNDPGDSEGFIRVNKAYEVLNDAELRAAYDKQLAQAEAERAAKSSFRCEVQQGRRTLLQMDEPQVHYVLLDLFPARVLPDVRPPINLSIVVDRSTSMRGVRLDQVRAAVLTILQDLGPSDSAAVVAFGDRSEVVVSPEQARDLSVARARLSLLQAGGGTEIGQGLETGLVELQRNYTREGVNHLVLLTDGRTYGDEELCVRLAERAAEQGITVNGVGIGSDWSDRLLDDLATRTGGNVLFMDSPRAITGLLRSIFESLSQVIASRVRLEGSVADQVDLRAAFRLMPDPMPMGDTFPMTLGNLTRTGRIRVLLEMVVHPMGSIEQLYLAELIVAGDVLGAQGQDNSLPVVLNLPVSREPDPEPPPADIVTALNVMGLYRMQEKARHEAELGQSAQAAHRLENLATHLLAAGDRELAKAALSEAERLIHTHRLSSDGEKVLKYGTRALMLPSRTGGS